MLLRDILTQEPEWPANTAPMPTEAYLTLLRLSQDLVCFVFLGRKGSRRRIQ